MDDRLVHVCPHCSAPELLPDGGSPPHRVICPACGFLDIAPAAWCLGAPGWATADAPERLLGCLTAFRIGLSSRERDLLYAAVARTHFSWCQADWFARGIEAVERRADGEPDPDGRDDFGRLFERRGARVHSASRDAELLCLDALSLQAVPLPLADFRDDTRAAFADAVRELFPNPFAPPEWKAEWCSSTAAALARHIYDARDFAQMPILADALQDAGCENDHILDHCRGAGPHARGCWVLDAVLGKR